MNVQYPIVDLIARHVMLALAIIIIVALGLSAIFWRLVERHGSRSWSWATSIWNKFRATALAEKIRQLPILGRLLSRALTAARYLGLVAIIGFVVAMGATAMFFELAEEIGVGEELAMLDDALSTALREHVSLETLQAFAVITHLGDTKVLAAIVLAVFAYLAFYRGRTISIAWLVAVASGGLLTRVLKVIFERSRPVHDHELTVTTSWSFPSGHAAGSMLVYGLLTYLLVRFTKTAFHIPIALAGIALIIVVGSSRVILQVHYLSDVLAGYMSAAAWVAICIAALEAIRWGEQSRQ